MIIGKLICCGVDPQTVYSEWFPRAADNAVFTAQIIYVVGDVTMTVKIFHKNAEDTGPGTEAGTILSTAAAPGLFYATIEELKEMVRYQVEVSSGDVGGAHYRFLPVTWFNTALVPTPP